MKTFFNIIFHLFCERFCHIFSDRFAQIFIDRFDDLFFGMFIYGVFDRFSDNFLTDSVTGFAEDLET